ncbi:hypothetical protein E0E54_12895 [Azotobacter chroococcum]|uniref:P-loop ATPase, Sll1717 family n=1 Tax=Azotobacter chroococcum TaxID=353 RepID=UPI001040D7D4|nr:hypothetical protein [Azotobacter chroococcum]TBW35014.1 hypothetical protein E0E54_12895 [Azotobacter chroococcum]
MDKHAVLSNSNFGQRIAEEEIDLLSSYFVETDSWKRLYRGDVDVVYGAKGTGKSALYSLLNSRQAELAKNGIMLTAAENPRGATAFRNLTQDPPYDEREFVSLWKLYFAALLHGLLVENGVSCEETQTLGKALEREGLLKGKLSLAGLLRGVFDYVKGALRPQALEGNVEIDPITQLPVGFGGKIIFSEPGRGTKDPDLNSVDNLLELANLAVESAGKRAWILLDRLDVAFSESEALEKAALRALFRVYLDLLGYSSIRIKIFLRSDIWEKITEDGFREASHVTRHLTISWDRNSLLNLVVRRTAHNPSVCEAYKVDSGVGRATVIEQESFFGRIFPAQVDVGPNKPTTLDWMLSRTRDGKKINAPRELIHFLSSLRDAQVKRFELREHPEPEGEQLFARVALKEALPEVSKVRLEQTLFAEHPSLKMWMESLSGEKTAQTPASLATIWQVTVDEALLKATALCSIGFFEPRGTKAAPEYWVPFIYRDALKLVQGAAE